MYFYLIETLCNNLTIPANGVLSCDTLFSVDEGVICNFTCTSGYELTGSNTRMCLNGTWSGDETICKRSTSSV